MESLLGNEVCVIGDKTVPVAASTIRDGTEYEIGGQWESINFSLKIRKSELETPPSIGERLLFRNKSFRVINVRFAPDNTAFSLDIRQL